MMHFRINIERGGGALWFDMTRADIAAALRVAKS